MEIMMLELEKIKNKVNNYEECSMDDIEEILYFIAHKKKQELGIDFLFEIDYDEGACVKFERTIEGLQQVVIGCKNMTDIKEYKEMKKYKELGIIDGDIIIPDNLQLEERKEFIELILSVFHELRHVKQNDNIKDHPILNLDNGRMTKEFVIDSVFPGLIGRFNYEQSMFEIDAMRTSLKETVDFFEKMDIDIKMDEVFEVMKEKELSYSSYNLQMFGDSYETAMEYFDQIYGNMNEIKGINNVINLMPENERQILYTQCQDLIEEFLAETDIDKKLDILVKMSLRIKPELEKEYPLIDIQNSTAYHR